MSVNELIGLDLDNLKIFAGGFTFEFSGRRGDKFKRYKLSTHRKISFDSDHLDGCCRDFYKHICFILENKVMSTERIDSDGQGAVVLRFEDKGELVIWDEKKFDRELFILEGVEEKEFVVE